MDSAILLLFLGLALGAALGGGVAFLLGAARARGRVEPALREAEARARAAGATADELRRELDEGRRRAGEQEAELRRLEGERAAAAARLGEVSRSLAAERQSLDAVKAELGTTFQALAAESLRQSNEGFLQLAAEKLGASRREGTAELAAREQAIASLVGPMRETLAKVDGHIGALERARGEAYVLLTEQVRALADGQRQLQSETGNLVRSLRSPAVRGRWGEIQLRRVVEIAGMMDHCDFVEQASLHTADGRLRPDMVVRLPGGRTVVVDAKAPLGAYLEAMDADGDEQRRAHLKHHAAQVRSHAYKLGAKSYWSELPTSPEFVVMFLPGDSFYSAALAEMPSLLEDAFAVRVLVATPTTLIGVLQAVHHGWRQERLAQNAEEISRSGRELHERIATLGEHLGRLGGALGRTVEAFNQTAASFEARVLPGARRLEDLGARGKKELPDAEQVDTRPRLIEAAAPPVVVSLPADA
jgi:DNA recombination protein RmuC